MKHMTDEEVLAHITKALEATIGTQAEIDPSSDLIQTGYLDSLDFVRFILELEKSLGRQFPHVDVAGQNLSQVSSLILYVKANN